MEIKDNQMNGVRNYQMEQTTLQAKYVMNRKTHLVLYAFVQ